MKIEGTFPKYKIEFEGEDLYPNKTAYVDFSKMDNFQYNWIDEAPLLIARVFNVDPEVVKKELT